MFHFSIILPLLLFLYTIIISDILFIQYYFYQSQSLSISAAVTANSSSSNQLKSINYWPVIVCEAADSVSELGPESASVSFDIDAIERLLDELEQWELVSTVNITTDTKPAIEPDRTITTSPSAPIHSFLIVNYWDYASNELRYTAPSTGNKHQNTRLDCSAIVRINSELNWPIITEFPIYGQSFNYNCDTKYSPYIHQIQLNCNININNNHSNNKLYILPSIIYFTCIPILSLDLIHYFLFYNSTKFLFQYTLEQKLLVEKTIIDIEKLSELDNNNTNHRFLFKSYNLIQILLAIIISSIVNQLWSAYRYYQLNQQLQQQQQFRNQ